MGRKSSPNCKNGALDPSQWQSYRSAYLENLGFGKPEDFVGRALVRRTRAATFIHGTRRRSLWTQPSCKVFDVWDLRAKSAKVIVRDLARLTVALNATSLIGASLVLVRRRAMTASRTGPRFSCRMWTCNQVSHATAERPASLTSSIIINPNLESTGDFSIERRVTESHFSGCKTSCQESPTRRWLGHPPSSRSHPPFSIRHKSLANYRCHP